jgi:hypothetical protein
MIVVDVMVPTIDGSDFGRFWVDRELWVSLMCRILSRKKNIFGGMATRKSQPFQGEQQSAMVF